MNKRPLTSHGLISNVQLQVFSWGEIQYPWAVSFDEPLGCAGVRSFEHGFLEPEPAYDLCNDVCPQGVSMLADIISIDHDHICPSFQASLCPPNQQVNIFDSFCNTWATKTGFVNTAVRFRHANLE